MISVEAAKKIIRENISPAEPVVSPLSKASYHILAADVYSPIDMPAYPQSSMDGYAFAFEDWKNNPQLFVNGVSAAGNENELPLQKGQAVRIFTGAPVPPGADTVVM